MSDYKYSPILLRRADFILEEARSPDGVRDQAISMAMRVISNHVTVGRDGSSYSVKKSNKLMSNEAKLLRQRIPLKEWHKGTTNEHPDELKLVWESIRENAEKWTALDVCNRLSKYPFVTITNEENKKLRKIPRGSYADPFERYKQADIEIVRLDEDPAT